MPNNNWITGSNQIVVGAALNKNQTDNFLNSGASNNFIGIGGNINITGIASSGLPTDPATDTNTTIELTSSQSSSIKGVTDTFTLDGSDNEVFNDAPIQNSTINFTVLGNGGSNVVDLEGVTNSKITVAIGVDNTATAPAGGNEVLIDNSGGTNTVSVGGSANFVELNGDATNKVTFTAGGNEAEIGFSDDDLFGNKSTLTFAGTGNELFGGDENFTVKGSTGSSTVELGDGTNTVTMGGTGNLVSVWGGNNNINAGGSGATVKILGLDGQNKATPIDPDGPDDPGVPVSPTDNVTISGAGDSVTATYENVNVLGTGVTGVTAISLGDGNNSVVLGDNALKNSAGGSTVSVGNGANSINVTGNGDTVNLGSGANGVTLSGDSETVNVTDPNGKGQDIVQLGSGAGSSGGFDMVSLDHAGGSVTGTGLGLTEVTQAGKNAVTVSLGNGVGDIDLGNGNDKVTANGELTSITAGNGNDTVTANGDLDTITLGNGNNTVTAKGFGDTISLGNGNNKVTANGDDDTFTFGNGNNKLTANGDNDVGTFGTPGNGGNNTLNAANGSGGTWTFNEATKSLVIASLGDTTSLTQTGGGLSANLQGDTDSVDATNVGLKGSPATMINAQGNSEDISFTNSGGSINLNPSSMDDSLTFTSNGSDKYAGKAQVTGLTGADPNLDLEQLFNTSGVLINSISTFLSSLTFNGTGETLNLQGGGSIQFVATNSFDPGKISFS
jgi:hypothetical protein